jgi:hypothetical protein
VEEEAEDDDNQEQKERLRTVYGGSDLKTLQNNWGIKIFRASEPGGSIGGTSHTQFIIIIITGKTAPS